MGKAFLKAAAQTKEKKQWICRRPARWHLRPLRQAGWILDQRSHEVSSTEVPLDPEALAIALVDRARERHTRP